MKRYTFIIILLSCLFCSCKVQQQATADRLMADVQKDVPFKVNTLKAVDNRPNVYSFTCDKYISLLPDYEVDNEGAVFVYATDFVPSNSTQLSNIIWRNIVINRKAKRVVCIDRFVQNGKTFGYVYVLQSATKTYNDNNTYHFDVSNHSLMLNVADAIEGMTELSLTMLQVL